MKTEIVNLTKKEMLVLEGLATGKCCKTIAVEMNVKISTVNTHCKNMLAKFKLHKMIGVLTLTIKKGYLKNKIIKKAIF
jgi:DNA-binding NarL/FixJ family response regulator